MASPPFSIAETVPADDDYANVFPTAERTYRDVVESWLLVNHNVQGRHDEMALDFKADPSAPGASITEVWASSTGNAAGALKQRAGASGDVEYVSPPPGVVLPFAGTTAPGGWLFAYGQAVSRTTYARLFDVISTTYGVGDGSTTFNLPDMRGRAAAGKDDMGGSSANRLTNQSGGLNGDTLGATGGAETHTLVAGELPTAAVTGTVAVTALTMKSFSTGAGGGSREFLTSDADDNDTDATSFSSATATFSSGAITGSSDDPHNNVQPTIILNYIIKV